MLLSTLSTTATTIGLAAAGSLVIAAAIRSSKKNGIRSKKSVTLLLIAAILLAFAIQTGASQLQTALVGDKAGEKPPTEENTRNRWRQWAEIAWRYFQPGVGVNLQTGLHYANREWARATDWDVGAYVIAVLDAETLGILPSGGEWGSEQRLIKVLQFLRNRPLTPEGFPYMVYDSTTGALPPDVKPAPSNPSDVGRLLLALYKLKEAKPQMTDLINEVIHRTNFEGFASDPQMWAGTSGFYAYLDAQGFKLWGFDRYQPVQKALNELRVLAEAPTVNASGVSLPHAWITAEPIIHAMLELEPNPLLTHFSEKVYGAMEARYKETGRLTAWSEGSSVKGGDYTYVYQWIVAGGSTWVVWSGGGALDIEPVVYAKVAIAMHALYNTPYTSKLVEKVLPLASDSGFVEGFLEADGSKLATFQGLRPIITDKTNAMILSAAKYALAQHR